MERLTDKNISVKPGAAKVIFGDTEIESIEISGNLLELILNGPTLRSVNKDVLRLFIRRLYDVLQQYENMEIEPQMANERRMMFASDEANRSDKAVFVQNLGWLLRQTREQVEHCFLDEQEVVHILFRGGHEKRVNVRGNSYAAVICEVTAAL